ncbi:hypothetical protein HK096_004013 [Nowakowskiella sp. JEL0078]|nr:hypothetical protein HK096_004013 [Nowakowskiella sp. JEL0078]
MHLPAIPLRQHLTLLAALALLHVETTLVQLPSQSVLAASIVTAPPVPDIPVTATQNSLSRGRLPASPVSPVLPPVPPLPEYIMQTLRTQQNTVNAVPSIELGRSSDRQNVHERRNSDPHARSQQNSSSPTSAGGGNSVGGLAAVWNGWKRFEPPAFQQQQQQQQNVGQTTLSRDSSQHRNTASDDEEERPSGHQRQNSLVSTLERSFQSAKSTLERSLSGGRGSLERRRAVAERKVVSPDGEMHMRNGASRDDRRMVSPIDSGYRKGDEAERRVASPNGSRNLIEENGLASWKLEMPSLVDMMGSEFGELFQKER